MARTFTYQTRSNYLDSSSPLVTATAQYLGPEKILLIVNEDGTYRIHEYPIPDAEGNVTLPTIPEIVPEDIHFVMLDQTNDQHVILMDMLSEQTNVNAPDYSARTTILFRVHTFQDGSTYKFRRIKPTFDDTLHTFSLSATTVNTDGTINFVRFATEEDIGEWLDNESLKKQMSMYRDKYFELYQKELSPLRANEKEVLRKVCELCDVLIYDLIDKVPNWMISPPSAVDVVQGGDFGELALASPDWNWGTVVDKTSQYA
jgi:hypothetical protein